MSDSLKLETPEEIVSYGIGRQMGDQLSGNSFEGCVIDLVKAGLGDAFTGAAAQVSAEDMNAAYEVIHQKIQAEIAKESAASVAISQEFFDENAKKDGIEVTESGLQYEVLVAGEGEKPAATNTVRVHYHGTFLDGKVFDSSVDRGQPAEFPVNGVIQGWIEGLQLMNAGSKWRLFIPSNLAYGEQGSSGAIPPNSALIFEVELLEIIG
jgi:FKBP-type peptidyl-prolyl cis-trans isomerase FklB